MTMPDTSGTRINGVTLTAMNLMQNGSISVGAPPSVDSMVYIPGNNGSFDATLRNVDGQAYFDRRQVTLPIAAAGTMADVASAKAAIGAYVGKQVNLYDARNAGTWRGPLSISAWTDVQEDWNMLFASTATLTVNAEPGMILPQRTVALTNGENDNIMVLGNMMAWPTFTLTPTGSSNSISVSVDMEFGTMEPTGIVGYMQTSSITGTVVLDCYRGLMTNGNIRLPVSLTSFFPYLLPGYMKVTLGGCSSGVMTYEPRVML